jgi:hypothetical protein
LQAPPGELDLPIAPVHASESASVTSRENPGIHFLLHIERQLEKTQGVSHRGTVLSDTARDLFLPQP